MLRKEAGQTLPMALLLLLLGAAAIIPTLSLATTNLKATSSVNQHTQELYAADAGINDALWYLQSDNRTKIINPTLQWPKQYWLSDYQPSEKVNNKDVQVNISTAWLLGGLTGYPLTQPTSGAFYANDHWTLIGALNISDNSTYVIQVSTDVTTTTTLDNISVWLPQGYSYVTGSAKINGVPIGGPGTNYTYVKNPAAAQSFRGGNIYKWSYLGTTFKTLSDIAPPPPGGGLTPADKYPPSIQLSFKYAVTGTWKQANGFFPWIQLGNQSIAWDSNSGFFHIQSTTFTSGISDNKTIEAYVPRGLPRYIGGTTSSAAAVQGDYIAIGNSLMTCCWNRHRVGGNYVIDAGPPCNYTCDYNCLGKYYTESSATINSDFGTSDAKIEKAYLYWTGWLSTNNPDTQATLKVNGTLVGTSGTVTADRYYNLATSGSNGYQYSCYADVSDRVKAITTTVRNTVFTVGAVNATPATTCASSPLSLQAANAGWSMIIIYSSLDTAVGVHQIYLYDNLAYLWGNGSTVSSTFTISGFQAPTTNIDAKVGYFIAEGDPQITPDSFQFKGQKSASFVKLGDHNSSDPNYYDNVFNSYSTSTGFTPSTLDGEAPGTIGGIDIDIYNKDKDGHSLSGIVQPGDTQAQILVQTKSDGIMMVYVVFSVTSTAVTPGQEFNVGGMLYTVE
jgi:hypothetical protein